MGDLIWIGNILIPRGAAICVAVVVVFLVVGLFTYGTRD